MVDITPRESELLSRAVPTVEHSGPIKSNGRPPIPHTTAEEKHPDRIAWSALFLGIFVSAVVSIYIWLATDWSFWIVLLFYCVLSLMLDYQDG